ncbi:MAG: indolepyruvate oxidoreductase subunit beta [Acidobacteria bacterium]|jgi:indolepyruvate ferredoxin oxidoreductase beta subunit|nr:indolepyruvate oxidoreductase subunit beta [Acidobacteriota bacterium]
MTTKSILICGVGGQGILTASDLLSDVLLQAGFQVKKSEVHGMSQRGGDVISTVRYGDEVFSPLPALQETDYILAFEKLEALRNIRYLSAKGIVLVNDFEWLPLPVAAGFEKYPQDIVPQLRRLAGELVLIPATRMAAELGNDKASNVVLIGLLASRMEIEEKLWLDVLRRKVPPRFLDLNLKAFDAGFRFRAGA